MSNSDGVAEDQNNDRTGAPGSSNPCNQCHSGNSFQLETTIGFFNTDTDEMVNEFIAGQTYRVDFTINTTAGSTPAVYGFQATALAPNDNSNAGSFSMPSSNTQLEDVNGRHIVEHNSASSSNVFSVEWTAPEGLGQVDWYWSALGANGTGSTSGDTYIGSSFSLAEANTPNVNGREQVQFDFYATDGRIHLTTDRQGTLALHTLTGQFVATHDVHAGTQVLDTRLARGVYLASFYGDDFKVARKIGF